ncbi:Glycine--tRNA ligase alpha subunit [Candidatus Hodgkinia cicadicola]|nr:Glycine--tRNA ligase alpha subunit [Candidatus Hodgkinia cicadicola]
MLSLKACESALDLFWMSRGCAKLDSSVNKLGAATFHPEMLKQVMLSDCCRLCYTQSTFRPYDSDYGLSHSLQHYFQYQVVIKPFYGLAGRLYLSSLECLGYVSSLYKLTLKESNWESSSLCAWGTGWECVLNSLEVSQITIFKQMCGIKCMLPVLEIAYGLERLVCALSCSRLNVTECELGFSYYNLNCLCVVDSFRVFYILERALLRAAGAKFFGVFYPACDMFLNLVCLYNQLITEVRLKRKVLRALLLKLQRLIRVLMLTLERAEWFRKL